MICKLNLPECVDVHARVCGCMRRGADICWLCRRIDVVFWGG